MLKPTALLLRAAEPLLPLGRHLPFALQRQALELGLRRALRRPLADGAFALLEGRWLRLEIADLGLAWCVSHGPRGLVIAREAPVDVCIRGNWCEFLLLASRQEDPDTLFFRRRLVIEGDTELGLAVKNLIDSLDPDDLPPLLWRGIRLCGAELAARQAA